MIRKDAISQIVHKETEYASVIAEMQAQSTTTDNHDRENGPNYMSQEDDM